MTSIRAVSSSWRIAYRRSATYRATPGRREVALGSLDNVPRELLVRRNALRVGMREPIGHDRYPGVKLGVAASWTATPAAHPLGLIVNARPSTFSYDVSR